MPEKSMYDEFPGNPTDYQAQNFGKTLGQLFRAAVAHAEHQIAGYSRRARKTARTARFIRFMALFLFATGTIAPVTLSLLVKLPAFFGGPTAPPAPRLISERLSVLPLAEIGFVLLALAGAVVIFDQFFDSSGSWIRFRQAEARLNALLAEFRFRWAEELAKQGGAPATAVDRLALTTLLRDFVTKIEMLAEEETKEWARRFSERIDAFDKNPNLKVSLDKAGEKDSPERPADGRGKTGGAPGGDAAKAAGGEADGKPKGEQPVPTSITVALEIDLQTLETGSLAVQIDDAPVPVPAGGKLQVDLAIGIPHTIVATGRRAGKTVRGELKVTPTPDDKGRTFKIQLQ